MNVFSDPKRDAHRGHAQSADRYVVSTRSVRRLAHCKPAASSAAGSGRAGWRCSVEPRSEVSRLRKPGRRAVVLAMGLLLEICRSNATVGKRHGPHVSSGSGGHLSLIGTVVLSRLPRCPRKSRVSQPPLGINRRMEALLRAVGTRPDATAKSPGAAATCQRTANPALKKFLVLLPN